MKPSEQAERATLGAVLHEPGRLDEIADRLLPSDFWKPYHQAVWAAILRLREQDKKVTPETVRAELPNRPEVAAHLARNAVPLVDLMEATPRTGGARRYADMVAEASLHRRVDLLGEHLAHVAGNGTAEDAATEARSERETLAYVASRHPDLLGEHRDHKRDQEEEQEPAAAEQGQEELARTRSQLEEIRTQTREAAQAGDQRAGQLTKLVDAMMHTLDTAASWSVDARKPPDRGGHEFVAPNRHHPGQAAPRPRHEARETDPQQEPAAQRQEPVPQQEPEPDPGRAELEDRLLSTLTAEPAQLDKMGDLSSDMFASPGRRGLFESLTRVHARDGAGGADELTVLWEAQRSGVLDEIDTETARSALSEGLPGVAATTAAELGQEAAKDHTARISRELRQAAADPTRDPGELVEQAQQSLQQLGQRCESYARAGTDRQAQLDIDDGTEPHVERDELAARRQQREPDTNEPAHEVEPVQSPPQARDDRHQEQAPDREQAQPPVQADEAHAQQEQQKQEQQPSGHETEANQPRHEPDSPPQSRRSEVPDRQRHAELQQTWDQVLSPEPYRAPERDTQDAEGKAEPDHDSKAEEQHSTHAAALAERFTQKDRDQDDQLHTAMDTVRTRAQERQQGGPDNHDEADECEARSHGQIERDTVPQQPYMTRS